MILALMNKENSFLDQCDMINDFTNDEKLEINHFLSWNDKEKDYFVYKTISSCFDYCMMTVKKDKSSYSNLFKNKVFYLDANIIFRLSGLNKEERKKVTNAFVNKCKDVGITLKYTNITLDEMRSTISYIVEGISKTLEKNDPISTDAMRIMSSKYSNLDFYDLYVEWVKKPNNKLGDYEGFIDYINKLILKVINNFSYESFDSYEVRNKEFQDICLEYKEYKISKKKDHYDESIKTDIENYLHVKSKNSKGLDNSFLNLHNYIITADHCYVEWAKDRKKGSIPFILLPSVWYSIILKYSGRCDDDYTAFTKFLNFSIVANDNPSNVSYDVKKDIINNVIALNEPTEVKDDIIYYIDKQLHNKDNIITSVEELVDEAHDYIINQRSNLLVNESEIKHRTEIIELKNEYENKIREERKDGYNTGRDDGYKEAIAVSDKIRKSEKDEIIIKLTNKKFKRTYFECSHNHIIRR
jgi:hypothetical protein